MKNRYKLTPPTPLVLQSSKVTVGGDFDCVLKFTDQIQLTQVNEHHPEVVDSPVEASCTAKSTDWRSLALTGRLRFADH